MSAGQKGFIIGVAVGFIACKVINDAQSKRA
jgi:hypothetical protein